MPGRYGGCSPRPPAAFGCPVRGLPGGLAARTSPACACANQLCSGTTGGGFPERQRKRTAHVLFSNQRWPCLNGLPECGSQEVYGISASLTVDLRASKFVAARSRVLKIMECCSAAHQRLPGPVPLRPSSRFCAIRNDHLVRSATCLDGGQDGGLLRRADLGRTPQAALGRAHGAAAPLAQLLADLAAPHPLVEVCAGTNTHKQGVIPSTAKRGCIVANVGMQYMQSAP